MLVLSGHVGGAATQAHKESGVLQEIATSGCGNLRAHPMHCVENIVANIAERDRAANAGDQHGWIGNMLGAETHAAERLHSHHRDLKITAG
nr:hypothetical protein [Corynebacterium ciconiae]